DSTNGLLELVWPLITEVLSQSLDRYLPGAAILPVVQSWVAGNSYADILAGWIADGGAIRFGKTTRQTRMEDLVELCDNVIGYQSTLVIAAVAENLGVLNPDGVAECIRNLGTLQKQVKYGI